MYVYVCLRAQYDGLVGERTTQMPEETVYLKKKHFWSISVDGQLLLKLFISNQTPDQNTCRVQW